MCRNGDRDTLDNRKSFPAPKRVLNLKLPYGVFRMPGFKYPTTEANVRRAIIFRSGGVFAFQGPPCRASLSRHQPRMTSRRTSAHSIAQTADVTTRAGRNVVNAATLARYPR
jgi:hypothetical protein